MGTELAKAYVQIVPSAKGIKGKISESINPEAGPAGKSFGSSMVGAVKNVIAIAGIGKAISASINEGGALQQSLGGIETLFKESADKVKANAANAYKNAGISANEYMEITTSFSASLLSSLSNDTSKAADIADMAMIDMSDNANKMGTDMESIQNAYQGFAKQNYTMLDNLKLGYGGTKTEMQRLLSDAQKITGVKYDINNLSDVYSAIHVIQGELGITGTTAKEAEETFSGSFASMKAAAKDLIGNLSLGNDIKGPLLNLQTTIHTFLVGNLIPMIGSVVKGIPTLVESGMALVTQSLNLFAKNANQFVDQGTQFVTSLVTGIVNGLPFLIEAAWNLALELGSALLSTDWGAVAQGLITSLRSGLDNAAGQILGTDGNLIGSVVDAIVNNLPSVLEQGAEIVTNIVNGILGTIPVLVVATGTMVTNFLDKVAQMLPSVLKTGVNLVTNIINGIIKNLPALISATGTMVTNFLDKILQMLPSVLNSGVQLILNVANGIIKNLPQIVSSATQLISNFINTIGQRLPSILETGITLLGRLAAGIVQAIPSLVAKIPQIVSSIINVFTSTNWLSVGRNIISGIASGLSNAGSQLWGAVKGVLGNFKDQVLAFFGIHSPSRWGIWVGEMIDQGFAEGIEGNLGPIEKSVGLMEGVVAKPFESNIEYNGSIRQSTDASLSEILYAILALLKVIVEKNSETKLYLKDREIARSLKEMGVVFE